jgi:protein-disulfide isomerase
MLLALIVGVAIVVAALMVVLSQLGGAGGSSASGGDVDELYSGMPHDGATLGKGSAPVTVYLYEEFQCPVCGQFSRETFPEMVDRSVRGVRSR